MKKQIDREKLIKSYQAQAGKLEASCVALKEQITAQQAELELKQSTLTELVKKLSHLIKLPDGEIQVTDHAVVRYLQRVLKMDFDALRAEILSGNVRAQINTVGDGNFPNTVNNNAFTLVVRNGRVVTIK